MASKNVQRKYSVIELQTITQCVSILRTCNGIPFPLANTLNFCKIKSDEKLKLIQDQVDLINERKPTVGEEISNKDLNEILIEKFIIDFPKLKISQFENLDIMGDKEVIQLNNTVTKFSYRDAYFNLINIIIE